jgi:hypothetical protein
MNLRRFLSGMRLWNGAPHPSLESASFDDSQAARELAEQLRKLVEAIDVAIRDNENTEGDVNGSDRGGNQNH